MKLRRIMIAAPKSGSGKTTVTCALLQLLKEQGQQVFSYKCGPDYIDPMFHKTVLQIPSKNLDTFFTDPETTRRLFLRYPGGRIFLSSGAGDKDTDHTGDRWKRHGAFVGCADPRIHGI